MSAPVLLLCAVIGALSCLGSAQIPKFIVCTSEQFYNAMEATCAHPPIGSSLKPGVKTLEEFGKLCCQQACSMRYFVHLCEYPEEERRRLAYPDGRMRKRRHTRKFRFY